MKQEMLRAELLHEELNEIEERLRMLDQQHVEAHSLIDAVEQISALAPGEEMLVPLATGIYVKATYAQTDEFMVNVGSGVVVPKTLEELRSDIEEQLHALEHHQRELHAKFEALLAQLDSLKESFKK